MKLEVVQKSKYFSKEADIVLLCLTHEHGYGNWSAIKHAARRDTRTRFDHLFMSRNEQELQRRVDILVKSLEKENQDAARKELGGAAPATFKSVAKQPDDHPLSDAEMQDLEDAEEERKSMQKMSDSDENEEVLQVGGGNESGEEAVVPTKASLVGAKRKRDDLAGEEEEDMDFEAIDNETKKFKM